MKEKTEISNRLLLLLTAALVIGAIAGFLWFNRRSKPSSGKSIPKDRVFALKQKLKAQGIQVEPYHALPGEKEFIARNGFAPEITRAIGREVCQIQEVTLNDVRARILTFSDTKSARAALEKLLRAESVTPATYLGEKRFIVQLCQWRYRFNGDRVIGIEKVQVSPRLIKKIKKALATFAPGNGGEI